MLILETCGRAGVTVVRPQHNRSRSSLGAGRRSARVAVPPFGAGL